MSYIINSIIITAIPFVNSYFSILNARAYSDMLIILNKIHMWMRCLDYSPRWMCANMLKPNVGVIKTKKNFLAVVEQKKFKQSPRKGFRATHKEIERHSWSAISTNES